MSLCCDYDSVRCIVLTLLIKEPEEIINYVRVQH